MLIAASHYVGPWTPLARYLAARDFWPADALWTRLLDPRGFEVTGFSIAIDWTQVP